MSEDLGELVVRITGEDELSETIDQLMEKLYDLAEAGDTASELLIGSFHEFNEVISEKIDHIGELSDAIRDIPPLPEVPAPGPPPVPPVPEPPLPEYPAPPGAPIGPPYAPFSPEVMERTRPMPGRPTPIGATLPPPPEIPEERVVWTQERERGGYGWPAPEEPTMHPETGVRIERRGRREEPMWGVSPATEAPAPDIGPPTTGAGGGVLNLTMNPNMRFDITAPEGVAKQDVVEMVRDPVFEQRFNEMVRRGVEELFRDYRRRGGWDVR